MSEPNAVASRSLEQRMADVRALLAAARSVLADRAALVPEIARATGLSFAGVELGLSEHLELDASEDDLARLIRAAGDAPRVHVILSANVFVAALRAVAIARAASAHVTVRPSRRDPAFARALVRAAACPQIELAEDVAPMDVALGEIHVYGRDDTIARVRAAARPGVRVRGHGAGMGVAWIGASADLSGAAAALARDVVPFDQRGCLSPRVALVAGGEARAADFARALHASLDELGARVPRGALSDDEREAAARYASTMAFAGCLVSGADHMVAVAPVGAPLVVPPPGRNVHVACAVDVQRAAALLAPLARAIVALGASDVREASAFAPPHARLSALGAMQRPPLDGPVDLRDGAR